MQATHSLIDRYSTMPVAGHALKAADKLPETAAAAVWQTHASTLYAISSVRLAQSSRFRQRPSTGVAYCLARLTAHLGGWVNDEWCLHPMQDRQRILRRQCVCRQALALPRQQLRLAAEEGYGAEPCQFNLTAAHKAEYTTSTIKSFYVLVLPSVEQKS
jgi:hypothetical protein